MSNMQIIPMTGKAFGATVNDVDLKDLSDNDFAILHDAFLNHGFLLFPEQHFAEVESVAFGERFGELEFG
ncbi:MAG: TauD/TfdA family dioxygenase, partial [Actinomycetota bacterium]|nr:TauD/TfdA family dioxygenase [Actinomycetota bacterium]